MRMAMLLFAMLVVALASAGCGATPASLGITGPGAPPPPPAAPDDSTISSPGIPDPGASYGPSIGPIPSSGRYFNYN
jgi:hypothetical protein